MDMKKIERGLEEQFDLLSKLSPEAYKYDCEKVGNLTAMTESMLAIAKFYCQNQFCPEFAAKDLKSFKADV